MKKQLLLILLCVTLSINAEQVCHDNIMATAPESHFTINSNNTVTDNTTGLTWMRCSLGQSGNDCNDGSAMRYTWSQALNEVTNNYSGWRLPNIKELSSIMGLKCYNPEINTEVFPSTISAYYWSSSPSVHHDNRIWWIDFYSGGENISESYGDFYVRLVRGGE